MGIAGTSWSSKRRRLIRCARRCAQKLVFDTLAEWRKDTAPVKHREGAQTRRAHRARHYQLPRVGLGVTVSAGGQKGDGLMPVGARHDGAICTEAIDGPASAEIGAIFLDAFSGGRLRRLGCACTCLAGPRRVLGETRAKARRLVTLERQV